MADSYQGSHFSRPFHTYIHVNTVGVLTTCLGMSLLSLELRCTCTIDADYVHGPIKATKDKISHGKREAQPFGFLSCLFSIPFPKGVRPLNIPPDITGMFQESPWNCIKGCFDS